MECFGGGIRHTLSRKCIEDEHHGAADHYAEIDKHKRDCAWVVFERQAQCSDYGSTIDAAVKRA